MTEIELSNIKGKINIKTKTNGSIIGKVFGFTPAYDNVPEEASIDIDIGKEEINLIEIYLSDIIEIESIN